MNDIILTLKNLLTSILNGFRRISKNGFRMNHAILVHKPVSNWITNYRNNLMYFREVKRKNVVNYISGYRRARLLTNDEIIKL